MQILPFAREEVVRPNREHYIQVATRTASASHIAFTGVSDPCAFFDARRHLYCELYFARQSGLSAARLARVADDRSPARARITGPRHREESLLIANLAAPMALG